MNDREPMRLYATMSQVMEQDEELLRRTTQLPQVHKLDSQLTRPISPLGTCPSPPIEDGTSQADNKNIILSQTANHIAAMSVTHSTGNGLKPSNIKASDSFFSKDHENVIVSKLAAKLDIGSAMERYSKEFKSIDPVDVTTTGLSALESE